MATPFYLGGYYLLKPKALGPEYNQGQPVHTTSHCISTPAIDTWAYGWGNNSKEEMQTIKDELKLSDENIRQIQAWAGKKFESNQIRWVADFTDLDTAIEYKQLFFSHLSDVNIYSIYLSASDSESLIAQFENEKHYHGEFTLRKTLLRKTREEENSKEALVGYDLIGVEFDGGYHTFYCHYAAQRLSEKFGLTLNSNGLFNEIDDWQPVKEYINNEKNGFEPVPWYIAKTRMVTVPHLK